MDHMDNVIFSSIFVSPKIPINCHSFIPQSFIRVQAYTDNDSDSDGEPINGISVGDGSRANLRG